MVAKLSDDYNEAPEAIGVASSGAVLEVLTAADGATWTIIVTRPDGMTAVIVAGEFWQTLVPLQGIRH